MTPGLESYAAQPLTIILLYSKPDESLKRLSYGVVHSVTRLKEEEGLVVMPAKSILAVISMQPHEHKLADGIQRYFVWERIGLEVSSLGGALEDLENEQESSGQGISSESSI